MPSAIENVALSPHPTTTSDIVRRVDARIEWTATDGLAIRYTLEGDCSRIRIPVAQTPRRADGLWRHTCFEIFILMPGGEGYFEFNFAPSGEWARYDFKSYREAAPLVEAGAPEIFVARQQAGLELNATIELPRTLDRTPLKIGLASVIEDDAGALRYWALCHPPGRPDFHHRDNFTMELPPPRLAAGQSSIGK